MGWLITGLLLALFGVLVVLTHRARRRPAADETLIEDLLGRPAGQALPGRPAGQALPGRPAGQAPLGRPAGQAPPAPPEHEDAQPPPVPAAQPAGDGDWLETQLTSITAWSDRMQEQIASWAADADPPPAKPEPAAAAPLAEASRQADHEPGEPPPPRPSPGRCIATTAKGSQCKRPARPGDTRCAIHAQRAHP
jgi:hypothetical protein